MLTICIAIVSLGKSSSTALERLYKQTAVLVELISEDGGVGSFVNIKNVLQSVDDPSRDIEFANHIINDALQLYGASPGGLIPSGLVGFNSLY